MKKFTTILLIVGLLAGSAFAYGPRGHRMVGAIADKRLAKSSKTVKDNLKLLLNGLTLQQAAILPDELKSFDKNPGGFKLQGQLRLQKELRDFLKANLTRDPGEEVLHRRFHYTDVPVLGDEQYSPGEVGRFEFDLVHMIAFCVRVLKGEIPEKNERKVTKSVAVILLAHYFGDIHQPLHVGAEYFKDGKPFEPSPTDNGFGDQGGNKLSLSLLVNGKLVAVMKKGKNPKKESLHGYWDSQTVDKFIGTAQDSTIAQQLASQEPADWKLSGAPETWAEKMADDILPLAREAHTRFNFAQITSKDGDKEITSGRAEEKKKTGGTSYAAWAAATVKEEIHKGGWRLAALLEEVLQ